MRIYPIIFFLIISSCGPKIESKEFRFEEISGVFTVKDELRGASSSNTYKIYYKDHKNNEQYILYLYGGTSPNIKIRGANIIICSEYQDYYNFKINNILDREKIFNILHESSGFVENDNC